MRAEIGNVKTTLIPEIEGDRAYLKEIQNKYKIFIPEAIYTAAYKLFKDTHGVKGWDGKASLIKNDGSFLSGLTESILQLVPMPVTDTRAAPTILINPNLITVPLRDYQQEVVFKSATNVVMDTWWPRGILYIATGGGKTEMAAAMIQMIAVNTLFVVHRKDLLIQTVKRFEKYGLNAGTIGAGIWDPSPTLNVGTIQTLTSILNGGDKEKQIWLLSWLPSVQQIFFDEAHMLASKLQNYNTFIALAEAVPAFFRWGLTATPFMRDKYSNWLLEGATGKVIHKVSGRELINQGYLSEAQIIIQTITQPYDCPKMWPEAYKGGIVMNRVRNKLIVDWANRVPKPSLVIVKDLLHLKILHDLLAESGLLVESVSGDTPLDVRQDALKRLGRGALDTLVCSTIFDEGIDLPELQSLIVAAAGKSVTKVLQRLGRVLRIHQNKAKAYIVDFKDKQSKILHKHSETRIQTYKAEGYNILEIK